MSQVRSFTRLLCAGSLLFALGPGIPAAAAEPGQEMFKDTSRIASIGGAITETGEFAWDRFANLSAQWRVSRAVRRSRTWRRPPRPMSLPSLASISSVSG